MLAQPRWEVHNCVRYERLPCGGADSGHPGYTRVSFIVATGALVGASERRLCKLGCTGKAGRFRSHPLGQHARPKLVEAERRKRT